MRNLNNLVSLPAGDVLIIAYGINDGGSIAGAGTFNGQFDAFRLDPNADVRGDARQANCHGKSVSALAKQYGGLNGPAAALGFPSVSALQDAIMAFCGR